MNQSRASQIVAMTAVLTVASSALGDEPAHRDAHAPLDARVADLLGRMTLEEKVAQMQQKCLSELVVRDGNVTQESLDKLFGGQSCGTLECPQGGEMVDVAVRIEAAQSYLARRTRLGVPGIPVGECLHGVLARGATIFPQACAQGATWNPDLIHEMAAAIAEEASAIGLVQALSPLFDVGRDARYGRIEECFGECPTLVTQMGLAYVAGMQGRDVATRGLAPDRVLATAKHFAGYSVPHGGLNIAPASIGEREMRSLHMPPFEAAIRQAGVCCVMPSYNDVDGVPAHGNPWLLTKVLREEWGFRGYVFSDYEAIRMLQNFQFVSPDLSDAARRAIEAGVDLEAPSPRAFPHLIELVNRGAVSAGLIDQAVARILRVKFLAGLFDGKRTLAPGQVRARVHTADHVALARRIAEESVILLKNDGNLLPLNMQKVKSIAVVGPNADQVQFGDYSATKDNAYGVTVLQGLRQLLGDRVAIHYAKGCDLVGQSKAGFDEAVAAARRSEVAVVVIGDTSMILGDVTLGDEGYNLLATVGEGYDRCELSPPGVQEDLVRAVEATGTPVIVVMVHGRPYGIGWMKQKVPAIVSALYPGEQAGHAVADILFGRAAPSGRLTVSVPQTAGHIPTVYDFKPGGRGCYKQHGSPEKCGHDYVFASPDPLFAFGFGLTYTTFEYGDLKVETPAVAIDGTVRLSFLLRNTGARAGREVAQVYVHDLVSSTTTPVMRLARFAKVALDAGQSRRLAFEIPVAELAIWNLEMCRVVEPGRFEVMVGASAEDIKLRGMFDVRR